MIYRDFPDLCKAMVVIDNVSLQIDNQHPLRDRRQGGLQLGKAGVHLLVGVLQPFRELLTVFKAAAHIADQAHRKPDRGHHGQQEHDEINPQAPIKLLFKCLTGIHQLQQQHTLKLIKQTHQLGHLLKPVFR